MYRRMQEEKKSCDSRRGDEVLVLYFELCLHMVEYECFILETSLF